MDENKSLRVCVLLCVFACTFSEFMKVRGGLAITTTKGPEMSGRNVSGGSVGIEGRQRVRGRKSVNTSEYALQMCRPVTLQVNTLADGQLRTGWPHRLPPGESAGERRRRVEGKEGGAGAIERRRRRWVGSSG